MEIKERLDKIWSEFLKPPDESVLYGKYQKPKTLIELEKLSKNSKIDLETLGFYIDTNTIPFAPQPIDMIPFASTGVDGTFFAFLTDFGRIKKLENAPIVMYCTADINSENTKGYRLFAKNINDFLGICVKIGNPYFVYESKPTEINFQKYLDEFLEFEVDDFEMFNKTIKKLKSTFQLKDFVNLNKYYLDFYQERKKSTNISTNEGFGIQFLTENQKNTNIRNFNTKILSKKELSSFLETQTKNSRLKFYRDYGATYQQIYKSDFLYVIEVLIKFLINDNFTREANVMQVYLDKQKNYHLYHKLKIEYNI